MHLVRVGLVAAAFGLGACGTIEPQPPGDTPDGGEIPKTERIEFTAEAAGVFVAEVDAHVEDEWVYLDLETAKEVTPTDPAHDQVWDLAFSRFLVRTNGGISGAGNGAAARVSGGFDAVTVAPSTGYLEDAEDSADEGEDPDYAFHAGDAWYAYDVATHRLDPRDVVYVVRTPEGHSFKVRMLGYYDDAGSSGHPSLRFAPVSAPPVQPADELVVDASSSTAWAYVRLDDAGLPIAGTETEWDLAFQRTNVRTNGGTSGDGLGGARLATGSFEDVTTASTLGFVEDANVPLPGPPGSGELSANAVLAGWYDYDGATHAVTPKPATVFLVRTAAGGYAKLQVKSWSSGTYTLRLAPVTRAVVTTALEVDASTTGAWVAVSLRSGAVITVADLSTSTEWDVAFSRTKVRTNGGTSGPGSAGAVSAGAVTLESVTEAPESGYVADAMAPIPGPPGSGEESSNATLGAWYDYDPTTHAVSPKDATFVVKTADGSFAKVRVTSWNAGILGLSFAYAGPGTRSF